MTRRGLARLGALLAPLAATLTVAACGSDAPVWKGDEGRIDPKAASIAPASTTVPDEPPMATNPADAPSPGGTNPDGSTFGTTAEQPKTDAIKQDNAAMLVLRTAMSIIEGCHSGRPSYAECDEQRDLGSRDEVGVIFSDGIRPLEVKASGTPKSVRLTTRSESGARFTVGRSPNGDRFSCTPAPEGGGACPESGTWSW
ncbi:MAG: hypothetical protein J7513_08535 [Solirubrobacteraceae bacterium]|nr:hypothetical protein [Solirubrobacteraceae bacterium]